MTKPLCNHLFVLIIPQKKEIIKNTSLVVNLPRENNEKQMEISYNVKKHANGKGDLIYE